jgi:predicted HAD superfamily Cof-like phosphohydrolase
MATSPNQVFIDQYGRYFVSEERIEGEKIVSERTENHTTQLIRMLITDINVAANKVLTAKNLAEQGDMLGLVRDLADAAKDFAERRDQV